MLGLIVSCVDGFVAGLLLLHRVPILKLGDNAAKNDLQISVIIPARNEETNLPPLLASLRASKTQPVEVIVVDDDSTDATAVVAARYGAKVLTSSRLPTGWTGKNWASQQGALASVADVLLFLDADTRFSGDGYERMVGYFFQLPRNAALSMLPYHRTERWYEELSLYFNVLMAIGAGGFSGLDASRLFGQSMMLRKDLYLKTGGHRSVGGEIMEALQFSDRVKRASGHTYTLGGRNILEMRMFPNGLEQLTESWRKGFAVGAVASSVVVIVLSICWLGASSLAATLLFVGHGIPWEVRITIYLLFALQIAWQGSQVGTFRWLTALFFPIPLTFYFIIFGQSAWRRLSKQPVTWKGRDI